MAVHGGRTVFVEGALPGERVRARVREEGKVLRGELLEVLEPSPSRRAPDVCPIWERCGGCDWLHLEEGAQRRAKEEIVLSALEHLGGISRGEIELRPSSERQPASPSGGPGQPPSPAGATAPHMGYRRRAVLHAVPGGLGFFARRSHEQVLVDRCPALVPAAQDLPGRLARALQPILKDISEVHVLEAGGQWSFSVHLRYMPRPKHRTAVNAAVRKAGARGAVLVLAEGVSVPFGDPILREEAPLAPKVSLRLRPDAFAQAHAGANRALVEAAVELLGVQRGERVLELYAGNGNFTFALAHAAGAAGQVMAVESSPVSLDLARASAAEARVTNVRFVLGDARKVAQGLAQGGDRFDALLADPPRSGAPGLGAWAESLGVRRVVYVACDPASLARDAKELKGRGFTPRALEVLDLFPQTRHVEAVMSFQR